jgi:tripartite-type tricarboxylate transporter receptor subunit TctC
MLIMLRLGFALMTLIGNVAFATAQDYPTRPVNIVVPFVPGGPSDFYGREIARYLSEALGQSFVVSNIPGANSVIGTDRVAKAPPDGYTLLLMSNTLTTIESLFSKKPFEVARDFAPVASLNSTELVMVVPRNLPAKDLGEFVALAKSKPKTLAFGSSGPGSPFHMAGELFKIMTGTDIVHIPYRTSQNAREDLIAGQLHMLFDTIPTVMTAIQAGQLKALAKTGQDRSPMLPDVPTFAELNFREYKTILWLGIMAPARTPQPIVDKLNAEINKILKRADVKNAWAKQDATPMIMSVGEFEDFVRRDIDRWSRTVKASGVRVD